MFFTAGTLDPLIAIGARPAAIAVCADANHPSHAQRAAERGAGIYLVSTFITPEELDRKTDLLRDYASRYPDEAPPTGVWPPDLQARLTEAMPKVKTAVRILSAPPGAEVFVDGRRVGVTPALAEGLSPGRHRIVSSAWRASAMPYPTIQCMFSWLTAHHGPTRSLTLRSMSARHCTASSAACFLAAASDIFG